MDTASHYHVPDARGDTASYQRSSIVPLVQSEAVILNGSQRLTRSPTPRSLDESLDPSSIRTRYISEDPAGLVKKVHSNLNIESPPKGTPAPDSEDGLMADGPVPKMHQLQVATLPTGICYDVRMRFHCELQPHQRPDDHHPEDPRRIFHIYQALCEGGLVLDPSLTTTTLVPQPLMKIRARNATPEEICLVHTPKHYAFMNSLRGECALT